MPAKQDRTGFDRRAYYESDAAFSSLSDWYRHEKEESFIDFVFGKLHLPPDGLIVEIGGGAGVHGRILARRFGDRYLFTDLSNRFVAAAKNSGLSPAQMNGLAMALGDDSAACIVVIGASTLLRDFDTRQRQFLECARILRPDGVGVFVTTRWSRQYHLWDRKDAEFLRRVGFTTTWLSWGIIPGRLWNCATKSFFELLENVLATTNLPMRSVLVCQKEEATRCIS